MILNESHKKTLEALKTYRYLTSRQLVRLGVYGSEKGLRDKILSRLREQPYPLIDSVDFGFVAGKGRLASVHCLTRRGALALANLHEVKLETISYPTGAIQFSRDYFHRLEFINLHISLRQWASTNGQEVEFFHCYFDSTGNQRRENSQLVRDTQVFLHGKPVIPDGNFRIAMNDGQRRLFTLELHKGNNTGRILEQLETHAHLIEQELLPKKYQHPHDNYILSVHENAGTLEAVKRRFYDSPLLAEHYNYYAFNLADTLKEDFANGWHYANGECFIVFSG